jgi:hypothetical protein
MQTFSHVDRMFQLDPPPEVVEYRRNKLLNAGADAGGAFGGAAEGNVERSWYEIDDDEGEDTGAKTEASASPAVQPQSEMDEKLDYYYGGGEEPRYIRISETVPNKQQGIEYRTYLNDNPATQFVISIVDRYGKATLKAVCPHCKTRLYPEAGLRKAMIIPVLGVSQSGKSVMLSLSFERFLHRYIPTMLPMGNLNQSNDVREYIRSLEKEIREKNTASSTNAVKRLMWTINSTEGKIALFTFDMPGEYIANSEEAYRPFREQDVANVLRNSSGIVLIVCPEQIELIRSQNMDDANAAGAVQMRRVEDMIQLICDEVDPHQVLKQRNLPICVMLTKLDMLRPGAAIEVDINKIPDAATLRELEHIITLPDTAVGQGFVPMGPLDNVSQLTHGLFKNLFRNVMNMIEFNLVNQNSFLGCFAVSSQGSGGTNDVNAAPIRPYDPFLWLFTKMGVFKQTGGPNT